jgi:hypothetical protein
LVVVVAASAGLALALAGLPRAWWLLLPAVLLYTLPLLLRRR